jgi:hypothetical protein
VAGDPPSQVVGLAPGVDEQHPVEALRHGGQQPLCEFDRGFLEVAAVGVECSQLGTHRRHHGWVGVAEHGHVVVGVEVASAVGGVEHDTISSDEVQRPVITQLLAAERVRAGVGQRHRRPAATGQRRSEPAR